ncbi:MAG TPA: type IV pilin protein [Burkholderiaceae bacterium]
MNRHVLSAASPASGRQVQAGFTLIELMVAIVILGILTAIALPIYKNHVISGKIPIATAGLQAEAVAMEQFFQDHQAYNATGSGTPCGSANNTTSNQYFTFSCAPAANLTATTYTLTAQGVGQMAAFTYTLDQSGVKSTTLSSSAPSGWSVPSGNGCWVIGPGGKC